MDMGISDFSIFLDSASKVDCQLPHPPWTFLDLAITPHPPWTWEFGILAFLDSASKVDHQPPIHPPWTWKFGILEFLDSASKVDHQPLLPPPTLDMGIWDFSIFGLSIKS